MSGPRSLLRSPAEPRTHSRLRLPRLLSGLIVTSIALAGCSSQGSPEAETPPPPSSTPTASATKRATPTPTPTPSPTPVLAFHTDDLVFNDALGLGTVEPDVIQGPHTVALVTERRLNVPQGALPGVMLRVFGDSPTSGILEITPESPRELVGYVAAVQADPSQPAGALVVTLEALPSSGLNAGGAELVLRTIGSDATVQSTTSLPASASGSLGELNNLAWVGQTAFIRTSGSGLDGVNPAGYPIVAVDTATGTILWSHDCEETATGRDGYLLAAAGSPVVAKCGQELVGLDPSTGQVVWSRTSDNYAYAAYPVPGSDAVARAGDFLISRATGADVTEGGTEIVADPITGYVAVSGIAGGETGLRIFDPAASASVLEITQADLEALGEFEPIRAYDGRLWFWGPNGVDVVELRTGAQDTALSPAAGTGPAAFDNVVIAAGQSWVLLTQLTMYGDIGTTSIIRSTSTAPGGANTPLTPVPVEELPPTTRN